MGSCQARGQNFVLESAVSGWLCDLGAVPESIFARVFSCIKGEHWRAQSPSLQKGTCWSTSKLLECPLLPAPPPHPPCSILLPSRLSRGVHVSVEKRPAWEPPDGQMAGDFDTSSLPCPPLPNSRTPGVLPGFPSPGRSAYKPKRVTLNIWGNWGLLQMSSQLPS